MSQYRAHCYRASDSLVFAGISRRKCKRASIRSSTREMRYGRRHRDEISVKGLIKRNKEIKRRRYPRRIIHIDGIHGKKDGSRAAVTAYRTRNISRFLVATSLGENRKLERTALFRRRGQAFALERRINRDTRQAGERRGGREKDGWGIGGGRGGERIAHPLDVYKGESWLVLEFVRRALPPSLRRWGVLSKGRMARWGAKDSCAYDVGNLLPRNHPAISMEREVVSTMAQAI